MSASLPFVHLLHDTGERYGELIERRWADVDLDRRTVLCQTTKTGRPRVLFFTSATAGLMRKTWTRREPTTLLFEGRLPGVPIRYRAAWRELVAGIGRPDLHMRDLRHVAAQRLLKGGVTVGVASQILGHSSNILQKRYGHLKTGALQDSSAESDRAILLHAGGEWQKIAMLQRVGHDVAAAKALLSQLESRQARHIVARNRLFKELADHS